MWGPLMVGALFTALNPVRLAIVALVISRPRPLPNLFAYWAGALVFGIPFMLVPLFVLHSAPAIESFTQGLATSSTFKHVQVGIGVFALSLAALMLARSRSRQMATVSESSNDPSAVAVAAGPPVPFSRLLTHDPEPTTVNRSPFRRLLTNARRSWEDGSLWVAGLLGGLTGGPSLDGIVIGTALIVSSGASTATQLVAAIVFVFAMLALVEIVLLCSVVVPAKTGEALQVVHDWVQANRRKIVIALYTALGIALIAQGFGVI